MNVFLMHADRDLDLASPLPSHMETLTQDLELHRLVAAMAAGNDFLDDIATRGLFLNLTDPDAILYRQEILRDALSRPEAFTQMYAIAVDAIEGERKIYFGLSWASPDTILYRSMRVLEIFIDALRGLRRIAEEEHPFVRSPGLDRLFTMLQRELDDAYFEAIAAHMRELKFPRGVLISADLGAGGHGQHHVLRHTPDQGWLERLALRNPEGYTFQIADRDEAGTQALSRLRGQGINLVANALAQSTDHILGFFRLLRAELAFYIGCLNLSAALAAIGEPLSFPDPAPERTGRLHARGLYDPCLALRTGERGVGNDVDAEHMNLMVVTGANQGGKSTFLRSVGIAQLMMQCGMFVPAEALSASVCSGVFTHFKREEDETMASGKLDEELARMSEIADEIAPGALLLCNESFAATNEREGSEIARQVIRAMLDAGITVVCVTHLYDLAHGLFNEGLETAVFLRAERETDGRRTYKLREGEPLPTSYGADTYRQVFGAPPPS